MVHRRVENGKGKENIWIKTKYLECQEEKIGEGKSGKIFSRKKYLEEKNHMTKLSNLITLLKRLRKLIEKDC